MFLTWTAAPSRWAVGFLVVGIAGCTTISPREPRSSLPPNAPSLATILTALGQNDEKVDHFRAEGVFTIQTPASDAVQRFHNSVVAFRRPADLYVAGRTRAGLLGIRLVYANNTMLLELPSEGRRELRRNPDTFLGIGPKLSPETLIRELFLSEGWAERGDGAVRMVAFDEARTTVVLEIGPRRRPRQRVEVTGPDWRVVKNELLQRGQVIATITKTDYCDVDGVAFPGVVKAMLPQEKIWMEFRLRSVSINAGVEARWFSIENDEGLP
ncbi:MAG TPA: hypothetical protein PLO62_05175 [Candidatus Hydrogenedentes bacterium]|nr:hypothetical protein [Candidatus Hydrogenedentota bacterium]HOS03944.1 hypothetical protein [Candidatus Hydrogenedentota bacterium]